MSSSATADELEIRNLIARFAWASDIGTIDDYMSVFTDDAAIEIPGMPARNGLEGLRSGAKKGREKGVFGPGSNSMHFLGSTDVMLDGGTAETVTTFVLYRDITTTPTATMAGRYYDRFLRTTAGWKLSYRRIGIGG
jgi:ketosteroid isomerase-like protein